MKTRIATQSFLTAVSTLTLLLAGSAVAAPLHREHLAADTKWVVHLDGDTFFKTTIGDYVARQLIEPKLSKARGDIKMWFDFDLDWRRIHGATVYGTDYTSAEKERGIVLIYTDLDVAKGLDGAIAKLQSAGAPEADSVKCLESGERPLYQLKEAYVALQPGLPVVVGGNKAKVLKARDVVAGRAANLKNSPAFTEFPAVSGTFCFLGAAEGFNESAPFPPQAKMLKMADSLRLTLGEADSKLFANLALLAKDAQVGQQIQQVVQGLIALVTLNKPDNTDLQQLAQGLKVSQKDRLVMVELAVPVEKITQRIAEKAKN